MVYHVDFLSGVTGQVMYQGDYKSKKAIRRANDLYSNKYGAYLTNRISVNGQNVNIWEIR